jgi:maltose/moltooligosaccharide transporter
MTRTRIAWGQVSAIGLGMGAISLAAGVYNAYVPLLLRRDLQSAFIVASLVAVRTVMGLVLNVVVATRSDQAHRKRGRRLVWVVTWMPVAGVLFALFPWPLGAAYLVTVDLVYALASSLFYAPVVALLPDVVPDEGRSRANGLISAMAGFAALAAFFLGPAASAVWRPLPFLLVGASLVAVSLVMGRAIHEPIVAAPQSSTLARLLRAIRALPTHPSRWLLAGGLLWTGAETSVESLFVTYAVYQRHLSSGAAIISIGIFALAYLVGAVPAGIAGQRLGRLPAVVTGLVIVGAAFAAIAFAPSLTELRLLAAMGGLGWALVNVNAYPWLVGLWPERDAGVATGLWLLATGVGGVAIEPAIGIAMDQLGYGALLVAAGALCALAGLVVLAVPRHVQVAE